MLVVDPLGAAFKVILVAAGLLTVLVFTLPQLARAPRPRPGRALRPRPRAPAVVPAAGGVERHRDALPRPGDGLDHVLRDGGLPEGRPDVERGLAQVRALRRRLDGDDALRPVAPLRDDGDDVAPRRSRSSWPAASPRRTASRSTRSRCSSSSASASRSRPCRSTSGARTSTRERPRPSPRSCPSCRRRPASRSCSASSTEPSPPRGRAPGTSPAPSTGAPCSW